MAVVQFRTIGDPQAVLEYDRFLEENSANWLINEIILYWKRVLKRIDLTSRSLFALIEPGSCFAGTWRKSFLPATDLTCSSGSLKVITVRRQRSI